MPSFYLKGTIMKLKLGEKTYHTKELTFGDLYKANEFQKYLSDGGSKGTDMEGEFNRIASYLVDLFSEQFTIQDVYEKLPNKGCMETVFKLIAEVRVDSLGELAPKNEPAVAVEN